MQLLQNVTAGLAVQQAASPMVEGPFNPAKLPYMTPKSTVNESTAVHQDNNQEPESTSSSDNAAHFPLQDYLEHRGLTARSNFQQHDDNYVYDQKRGKHFDPRIASFDDRAQEWHNPGDTYDEARNMWYDSVNERYDSATNKYVYATEGHPTVYNQGKHRPDSPETAAPASPPPEANPPHGPPRASETDYKSFDAQGGIEFDPNLDKFDPNHRQWYRPGTDTFDDIHQVWHDVLLENFDPSIGGYVGIVKSYDLVNGEYDWASDPSSLPVEPVSSIAPSDPQATSVPSPTTDVLSNPQSTSAPSSSGDVPSRPQTTASPSPGDSVPSDAGQSGTQNVQGPNDAPPNGSPTSIQDPALSGGSSEYHNAYEYPEDIPGHDPQRCPGCGGELSPADKGKGPEQPSDPMSNQPPSNPLEAEQIPRYKTISDCGPSCDPVKNPKLEFDNFNNVVDTSLNKLDTKGMTNQDVDALFKGLENTLYSTLVDVSLAKGLTDEAKQILASLSNIDVQNKIPNDPVMENCLWYPRNVGVNVLDPATWRDPTTRPLEGSRVLTNEFGDKLPVNDWARIGPSLEELAKATVSSYAVVNQLNLPEAIEGQTEASQSIMKIASHPSVFRKVDPFRGLSPTTLDKFPGSRTNGLQALADLVKKGVDTTDWYKDLGSNLAETMAHARLATVIGPEKYLAKVQQGASKASLITETEQIVGETQLNIAKTVGKGIGYPDIVGMERYAFPLKRFGATLVGGALVGCAAVGGILGSLFRHKKKRYNEKTQRLEECNGDCAPLPPHRFNMEIQEETIVAVTTSVKTAQATAIATTTKLFTKSQTKSKSPAAKNSDHTSSTTALESSTPSSTLASASTTQSGTTAPSPTSSGTRSTTTSGTMSSEPPLKSVLTAILHDGKSTTPSGTLTASSNRSQSTTATGTTSSEVPLKSALSGILHDGQSATISGTLMTSMSHGNQSTTATRTVPSGTPLKSVLDDILSKTQSPTSSGTLSTSSSSHGSQSMTTLRTMATPSSLPKMVPSMPSVPKGRIGSGHHEYPSQNGTMVSDAGPKDGTVQPVIVQVQNGTLEATTATTTSYPSIVPTKIVTLQSSIVPGTNGTFSTVWTSSVLNTNGTLTTSKASNQASIVPLATGRLGTSQTSAHPFIVPATNGTMAVARPKAQPSIVPVVNGSLGWNTTSLQSNVTAQNGTLERPKPKLEPVIVPFGNGTLGWNATSIPSNVPTSNGTSVHPSVPYTNGTLSRPGPKAKPVFVPIGGNGTLGWNSTLGWNTTSVQSNLSVPAPNVTFETNRSSNHPNGPYTSGTLERQGPKAKPIILPIGRNGTLGWNATSVQSSSSVPALNGTLDASKLRPIVLPSNRTLSGYQNSPNPSTPLGHNVPVHIGTLETNGTSSTANSTSQWRKPIVPLSGTGTRWTNGTTGGSATTIRLPPSASSLFVSGVPLITITETPRPTSLPMPVNINQALDDTRRDDTTSANVPSSTGTFKIPASLSAIPTTLRTMFFKPNLAKQEDSTSVQSTTMVGASTGGMPAPSSFPSRWNLTGLGWNQTVTASEAKSRKVRLE